MRSSNLFSNLLTRSLVCLALASAFALAAAQPCLPAWQPQTEEEQVLWEKERAEWADYLALLPVYLEKLSIKVDTELLMPVEGVSVDQVPDTWGAPRDDGGRVHEGQDIFAARGTRVFSATPGYIWRISERKLGGKTVTVVGGGGRRYYYAHLSRYAEGLNEGQSVTMETLLGYVGKTGNAEGTLPHLHLGVSTGNPLRCERKVFDPLPLLMNR